MAIPRTAAYDGPAFFSYGFRPFFLFGSVFAALTILLWLPEYLGEISIPTLFAPTDWHIHEMLFGFLPAIITGFLFTAVPNWTGRMPLNGKPLMALVLLWAAGRVAISTSAYTGWVFTMIVDCAFMIAIIAVIGREIIVGNNLRNLKVLIPTGLIAVANIVFHIEAHFSGTADFGRRIAIGAILMLIMIIGGRIIPSFTRNWLSRMNPGRLPASFSKFDLASMASAAAALLAWVAMPGWRLTGLLLVLAGAMQLMRLGRWAGWRAWRDPLVWVLHVSYLSVGLGLLALGIAILSPNLANTTIALHIIGIGAIGGMVLSVMIRASRGHTGQSLSIGISGKICFAALIAALIARVMAEVFPAMAISWLHVAAFGWIIAFGGFGIAYTPALLRPRKS